MVSACSISFSASWMNSMPSMVRLIPRLERSKMVIPSSASRSLTALLRVGCEINRCWAALFMEL